MLKYLLISCISILLLMSCSDNDSNNNPVVPDTTGSKLSTSKLYPDLLLPLHEANTYTYNLIVGTDTSKRSVLVKSNNGNGFSLNSDNLWLGNVIFEQVDGMNKLNMHTLKLLGDNSTGADPDRIIAQITDKATYVTSDISKITEGVQLTQNGITYSTTKITYTQGTSEYQYYFVKGKGLIRYSLFTNNVLKSSFEMESSVIK